jgi:uncharacterized protein YcgI (DUF1989 family)
MTVTQIPARGGWSQRLQAGERFRLIDVEGGQAGDLWAFNVEDTDEYLSAGHSRVAAGEVYPRAGWTFLTNERRPIVDFVADTSPGKHDCLAAACDRWRYELLGAEPGHASCEGTLQIEARKHGFEVAHAPQPINVFHNLRVLEDGTFRVGDCLSKPGDAATFEVLMDCVVVVSACPQDILTFQPNGPTDLAVELLPPGA